MKKWSHRLIAATLLITSLTAYESVKTIASTEGDGTLISQNAPGGNRLEAIKKRGKVICGVNGKLPGFSFVDEKGEYTGLDVDVCRGVAAALFNDPTKVEYRNVSTQERFAALQSGEIDILSRNTTLTISRDTSLGLDFMPVIFYDGQGILVTKASKVKQVQDLKGKSICVQQGTTTEQNLADQMRKLNIPYTPVVFDDIDATYAAYQEGRCQAVTSDRSQLSSRKKTLPKPEDHVLLEQVISKEPLAPAVSKGDAAWADTVKWVIYAMIEGEELGITSKNIGTFQTTADPAIKRFLGLEGKLGQDMGLPNDFAARVIKHVGNYGESYDRNITKALGLPRGQNQLWSKGGLLYSPPFR